VAVNCGVTVGGAVVRSGVTVGSAAIGSGVAVGSSIGTGVATVGVSMATDCVARVGLFAKHWATPEVIAAAIETIPNAIAQRARR